LWASGIRYLTEPKEGIQHREARRLVEFYLQSARGRATSAGNYVQFKPKFVKENKLEKRFQGHSYDIVTQEEIIEIDDLNSHPKKSHRIADGIAEKYIKEYHPEYKFYRLLKEEIADRRGWIQPDCYEYLRKNLF
jgi:hypothetical protein